MPPMNTDPENKKIYKYGDMNLGKDLRDSVDSRHSMMPKGVV